jgi:hypothetical protein
MIPTLLFPILLGVVHVVRLCGFICEGRCGPRALFTMNESCASVYSSEVAHVSNIYFHIAIVIGAFDVLVVHERIGPGMSCKLVGSRK